MCVCVCARNPCTVDPCVGSFPSSYIVINVLVDAIEVVGGKYLYTQDHVKLSFITPPLSRRLPTRAAKHMERQTGQNVLLYRRV